jgi:hypothetical protein
MHQAQRNMQIYNVTKPKPVRNLAGTHQRYEPWCYKLEQTLHIVGSCSRRKWGKGYVAVILTQVSQRTPRRLSLGKAKASRRSYNVSRKEISGDAF